MTEIQLQLQSSATRTSETNNAQNGSWRRGRVNISAQKSIKGEWEKARERERKRERIMVAHAKQIIRKWKTSSTGKLHGSFKYMYVVHTIIHSVLESMNRGGSWLASDVISGFADIFLFVIFVVVVGAVKTPTKKFTALKNCKQTESDAAATAITPTIRTRTETTTATEEFSTKLTSNIYHDERHFHFGTKLITNKLTTS